MKIALSMIVKNEGKIIDRCLDAVVSLVDYIYIEDTGSTDNTIESITAWSRENKVETVIQKYEFTDFASNRNSSLQNTMKTFQDADYILFIDADMEIVISSDFDRNTLVADAYLVQQKSNELVYHNIRMVRTKELLWRYVGKTHEVLICDKDAVTAKMSSSLVCINDIGDGGSKTNKYARDETLLQMGLQEIALQGDPDNLRSRYQFYLAQTYFCKNEYEKALEMYQLCLQDQNSWSEQRFYCQYMSAECCHNIPNKEYQVLHYCSQALAINSLRAEPYFRMLRYFNDNKLFVIANCIGKMAMKQVNIQLSSDHSFLFQDNLILKYQIPLEAAVADYYDGKANYKHLMTTLVNQLQTDKSCPADIRECILANCQFL